MNALLLLAQLPPVVPPPSTRWEFWAVMGYLTIQAIIQLFQLKQGRRIEKQTNGMVASSVLSASIAGEARGETKGRIQEQARIAAKLAVADTAAAVLESSKQHS